MPLLSSLFRPGVRPLAVVVTAAAFSVAGWATGTSQPNSPSAPPDAGVTAKQKAAGKAPSAAVTSPSPRSAKAAPSVANAIWADKTPTGAPTGHAPRTAVKPAAMALKADG